jgi:nucleoid-associated protein YgaU
MEKLTIRKLDNSKRFECQFNPTDFQISKQNHWEASPAIGTNAETLKFTGGAAQDITLKLLFDNTAPRAKNGNQIDLTQVGKPVTEREDYRTLKSFTEVDGATREGQHTNKGEPPRLRVQWGNYIAFTAVITQFSEHYLLFAPDGGALRAEVSLTLKQAQDESKKGAQNPTSYSEARRTWQVKQGERLDLIAYHVYGDATVWRLIAKENGILNPQKLRSGAILRLPSWTPT